MVGREYSPGLASFRLGEHIEMRLQKKNCQRYEKQLQRAKADLAIRVIVAHEQRIVQCIESANDYTRPSSVPGNITTNRTHPRTSPPSEYDAVLHTPP